MKKNAQGTYSDQHYYPFECATGSFALRIDTVADILHPV